MKNLRTIIGVHACLEALKVNPEIIDLNIKKDWNRHEDLSEIVTLARQKNVRIKEVPESQFNRFGGSHQGVALQVGSQPEIDWEALKTVEKATVLILDGIVDPHNLGAVMRTGWLMGISGILIPDRRSVDLTPTVAKVACGGAEHVPVEVTSNLAQSINDLKELGFWVYGLSHEAKEQMGKVSFAPKVVWVLGSEEKGVRKSILNLCDVMVRIPQADPGASFNASVAAAIAMWESKKLVTT